MKNALSPHQGELEGELQFFCLVTVAYSHLPAMLEMYFNILLQL